MTISPLRPPTVVRVAPVLTILVACLLTGCGFTAAKEAAGPVQPATSSAASQTPAPSPAESAGIEPEPTADPEGAAPAAAEEGTALAVLGTLPVKGRAPMTNYERDGFGPAWADADRNGCDQRNDRLASFLADIVYQPGTADCVVDSGDLDDPYTGGVIHFVRGDGTLVDIDHVVALGNAWATGAAKWPFKKRVGIATDPMNLLPVDASANRQKGDGDAATWLPSYKPYRCDYVARQIAVKAKYGLWVTAPEKDAMIRVLATCPDEQSPKESGYPVHVSLNLTDPQDQASPTTSGSTSGSAGGGSASYENCDAVRAAGAAPIRSGQPGYGSHLDRDGDGIGCE